jgi:uncharacterized membrane protein YdbT with pleckstrin-like domain
MSYIENNLMSGEVIVHRANLHWMIYLPSIFIGLFSVLICFIGGGAIVFGIMLLLFLVMPMAVSAAVSAQTSEFAVTNKRVMMKVGFIRRTSLEVLLTKVEALMVDQDILGRIFGFGTIIVEGTGGTKNPFSKIANPMVFRRAVQEQIEKATERK